MFGGLEPVTLETIWYDTQILTKLLMKHIWIFIPQKRRANHPDQSENEEETKGALS
jgi:hypothetical protein